MVEGTSQRKVVGRTVVIVLGVICIVLSAGLIGVLAAYLPIANSISSLNSQIAAQNATITSQQQQIVALQNSLSQQTENQADKDAKIAELNNYAGELQNLLWLNASSTLVQNQAVDLQANENVSVWNDVVGYAGYMVVEVQSSSNTTFANVVYSTAYGVNYDEKVVVGTGGVAAFPVLPGLIDVRVGNTETSSSVSATVTARYHY